jgi:spore maturation protein SpmA/spore maturation protein SpmB
MGIMKIGEKGGVINKMSHVVSPFFSKLFPEVPKDHPAIGSMFMNLSATMIGIDNAATPMGLKAMKELQELNPDKTKASNAMIMFLVLVTSGLTLVPVSIMVYRAQMGAANPADVFLPILIATFCAAMAGIISVAIAQKINLLKPVFIGTILGICAFVGLIIWAAMVIPKETFNTWSTAVSAMILLGLICWFIIQAMVAKINVYDAFIEGAKGGFSTAVGIIPYLIAILVGIGVFRASGAMDWLISGIAWVVEACGGNSDIAGALPTALMKPLSGSGARGMMLECMQNYGADSFAGRLSCIFQGSTDTTFYILAVYFGSVGIRNTRYALPCGLAADLASVIAAIIVALIFFG